MRLQDIPEIVAVPLRGRPQLEPALEARFWCMMRTEAANMPVYRSRQATKAQIEDLIWEAEVARDIGEVETVVAALELLGF